jgi:hypothetical protein
MLIIKLPEGWHRPCAIESDLVDVHKLVKEGGLKIIDGCIEMGWARMLSHAEMEALSAYFGEGSKKWANVFLDQGGE